MYVQRLLQRLSKILSESQYKRNFARWIYTKQNSFTWIPESHKKYVTLINVCGIF